MLIRFIAAGAAGAAPNSKPQPTGIEWNVPRQHSQHQYYSTTELGETKLSPQEVKALLERLAEQWPGGGYDLIHRNCCHFADAFAVELGMGNIPRWVNRFARTVDRSANLPRLAHCGKVLQLTACRTFQSHFKSVYSKF